MTFTEYKALALYVNQHWGAGGWSPELITNTYPHFEKLPLEAAKEAVAVIFGGLDGGNGGDFAPKPARVCAVTRKIWEQPALPAPHYEDQDAGIAEAQRNIAAALRAGNEGLAEIWRRVEADRWHDLEGEAKPRDLGARLEAELSRPRARFDAAVQRWNGQPPTTRTDD